MFRRFFALLTLAWMVVFAVPTMAQNPVKPPLLTEQSLDGGYTLLIPTDWEIEREEGGDQGYYFYNGELEIYVLGPVELEKLIRPRARATTARVMETLAATWFGSDFEMQGIETIALGDEFEMAFWDYTDEDDNGNPLEGTWFILRLENDTLVYFDVYGDPGVVYDEQHELVVEIVFSLTVPEKSILTPRNEPEDCTLRTTAPRSVQLRVGPGINESGFAFLPTWTNFTVIGRSEAEDGSVWLQLDKGRVAPNSGVAEVWVAMADVDMNGDCEALIDSDAPPVASARRSISPTSRRSNNGSDASVRIDSSIMPTTGVWSFTFGSEFMVSCEGRETIRVNATEEITSGYSLFLNVDDDGASISLSMATLSRTDDGVYSGTMPIDKTTEGTLSLRVVSPTEMTGQLERDFALDNGIPCSAVIDTFANRN